MIRTAVLVALLGFAATACGSSGRARTSSSAPDSVTTTVTSATGAPSTAAPSTAAPTTAGPATSAPPPTGPVAPHATEVQVADAANATTIAVAVGSTITVVLHSTYWTIDPPAGPVLVATGAPSFAPGQGCGATVPGSGCGTVTLVVRAAAAGTATITAERTSCGEALRCAPDQSTWKVTVRVGA